MKQNTLFLTYLSSFRALYDVFRYLILIVSGLLVIHINLYPCRILTRDHFSTCKIETEAIASLFFPLKFEPHRRMLILINGSKFYDIKTNSKKSYVNMSFVVFKFSIIVNWYLFHYTGSMVFQNIFIYRRFSFIKMFFSAHYRCVYSTLTEILCFSIVIVMFCGLFFVFLAIVLPTPRCSLLNIPVASSTYFVRVIHLKWLCISLQRFIFM